MMKSNAREWLQFFVLSSFFLFFSQTSFCRHFFFFVSLPNQSFSIFLIPSRIDLTISYHQQSSLATWSGPILLFFSLLSLFLHQSPCTFCCRESFQLALPLSVSSVRSMTSTRLTEQRLNWTIWYVITAELLKR